MMSHVPATAADVETAALDPKPDAPSSESALQDDIKRHGENAYYYAHRRNIGPTSIRAYDEPPRLLSSTGVSGPAAAAAPLSVSASAAAAASARQVPISTYAWADNGETVKVYVDQLPGLDSLTDDGAVTLTQPDDTTVELRVSLPGATHVLKLAPLYASISSATTKRTAKRVIVTLRKAEGKSFTWYTLLGSARKPGGSGGGLATSPLSVAGEDLDLSGMLGGAAGEGLDGVDDF